MIHLKRPLFALTQLSLLIAAASSQQAFAEQTPETRLGKVVVLGTSREDITSLQSSAPVDVVSADQLKSTGAITLNQALEKLHPSFNFPQGQNSWNGQNTRSAALRGVSPAYTLVLVNGKRRHTSSQITNTLPYPPSVAVDINTIPVSAIERVEILRDGAAAQYGSDAIAGVINIVLREDSEGGNLNARIGGYSDGGGYTRAYNGWKGFNLGDRGFLNLSADYFNSDFVDRADADWRPQFANGDSRNQTIGNSWSKWGNGSRESWSVLANGEFDLNDEVKLYGYLNYADRESGSYVNTERVINSSVNPTTLETAVTGANSRNSPLYPDGYQPQSVSDSQDLAAVFGTRFGDAAGSGKFDLSLSHGRNESGKWTRGTVNPSYGVNSPRNFYWGSTKSNQTTVQGDYVKDLPVTFLPAPVVLSAGLLYRYEKWATGDLADEAAYTNGGLANSVNRLPIGAASVDSPIQPADAGSINRNVGGGYLGVEADLTERLQVGITGRYEDYSDFGDTFNGKLTLRYELTPQVALRGTYSSGFHAPSLAQLGSQITSYTTTWSNTGLNVATPGQTRFFRPDDPQAAIFGAKALDPEKSDSFSAGIVLQPDDTSSITIDAYYLTIKDSVVSVDRLSGTAVTQAFNSVGLTGFTQAQYYFNGWDSKTKGLDIVGKKHFSQVYGGTLDLSAGFSLNKTEVDNVRDTVQVGGATLNVIDPYRIRDAERSTPKNKLILDARYNNGPWTVDVFFKRYGSYWYNASASGLLPGGNGNRDQRFSPEWYVDLDLNYAVTSNWDLFLGTQNLFNKYPDKYELGNRSNGVNNYGFLHPNGSSGRFVYAGVNYAF
ncbi:TonB-dependent receptor plug domain-containing protein [Pseudomonas sp. LRF_L74]|uniref:TonB-dependent receptor plug domain-containing protein n=1 Tax=Pseudomonas sp. LRF_L74 TaxID=3369422 RepID=UPI003F63DDF7